MIEAPPRPTIRIVTLCTFRSQATLMMAVLVTALANARHVLEIRAAMTFLARHHGVLADQRKTRHIVVKIDLLPPAGFLVTTLAFDAERALVRVVLFVTRHAGHREFFAIG